MAKQTQHPIDLATRFKIEELKQLSERKQKEIDELEKSKQRELEEAEKLLETAIEEAKIDERLWRETDDKLVKEQQAPKKSILEETLETDDMQRLERESRDRAAKATQYESMGTPSRNVSDQRSQTRDDHSHQGRELYQDDRQHANIPIYQVDKEEHKDDVRTLSSDDIRDLADPSRKMLRDGDGYMR